jgi:Polyketide cyclase / dehydrase and lipid transport
MSTLSRHFIIAESADAVWDLVGRRFGRIGDWATAIPTSTAIGHTFDQTASSAVSEIVDAPVAGRVCQTGIRLMPQVTETIVAYDDATRTLIYQASGLPGFVTTARNTWTVTPLEQRRTRVSLQAQFDTRGLARRPRRLGDPDPGRADQPTPRRGPRALPRARHTLTAQGEATTPGSSVTDRRRPGPRSQARARVGGVYFGGRQAT